MGRCVSLLSCLPFPNKPLLSFRPAWTSNSLQCPESGKSHQASYIIILLLLLLPHQYLIRPFYKGNSEYFKMPRLLRIVPGKNGILYILLVDCYNLTINLYLEQSNSSVKPTITFPSRKVFGLNIRFTISSAVVLI